MANVYKSVLASGGTAPTGNAVPADVLSGKTFSNADGTDKVGTMPNNGAVAPTALNPGGSYTIPAGYHNGQGAVSAKSNTATYTASSRGAALDMGAANLNRYVNTNGVPNSNTGTYTFPANDTGGTKDLGATNDYRYVNAQNVYNKGKADGASTSEPSNITSYEVTTTYAPYYNANQDLPFKSNGDYYMFITTYNATNVDTTPLILNGLTGATATHIRTVTTKNANANYPSGYNSKCSLYKITVTNYTAAKWTNSTGSGIVIFKL